MAADGVSILSTWKIVEQVVFFRINSIAGPVIVQMSMAGMQEGSWQRHLLPAASRAVLNVFPASHTMGTTLNESGTTRPRSTRPTGNAKRGVTAEILKGSRLGSLNESFNASEDNSTRNCEVNDHNAYGRGLKDQRF